MYLQFALVLAAIQFSTFHLLWGTDIAFPGQEECLILGTSLALTTWVLGWVLLYRVRGLVPLRFDYGGRPAFLAVLKTRKDFIQLLAFFCGLMALGQVGLGLWMYILSASASLGVFWQMGPLLIVAGAANLAVGVAGAFGVSQSQYREQLKANTVLR